MREILVTNNPDHMKGQISFEERDRQIEEQERQEALARKREKQSPFTRWTQFNNDHTKELMELAIQYPKAHAILYFLVDQMDNYNAVICSTAVLTELLGVSRQTVSTSIKLLKEKGFIAVYKSGTSNVYAVNDEVFWKSWGNNLKYSKFPANVVLAESEQVQFNTKSLDKDKIKVVKGLKKKSNDM